MRSSKAVSSGHLCARCQASPCWTSFGLRASISRSSEIAGANYAEPPAHRSKVSGCRCRRPNAPRRQLLAARGGGGQQHSCLWQVKPGTGRPVATMSTTLERSHLQCPRKRALFAPLALSLSKFTNSAGAEESRRADRLVPNNSLSPKTNLLLLLLLAPRSSPFKPASPLTTRSRRAHATQASQAWPLWPCKLAKNYPPIHRPVRPAVHPSVRPSVRPSAGPRMVGRP